MLTFKKHAEAADSHLAGVPAFRVVAGARELGHVFHRGAMRDRARFPGPSWLAIAPDGQRYGASSKPRAAQMLQMHASGGIFEAAR